MEKDFNGQLAVSYGKLDAPIQACWRSLAVFSSAFDNTAAQSVWDMEKDGEVDRILAHLQSTGMLQRDHGTGRFYLHASVHDYALDLEDPAWDDYRLRHATHYLSVLRSADALVRKGAESYVKGLALFEQDWDNIKTGQAWSSKLRTMDSRATTLCSAYAHVGINCLNQRIKLEVQIAWLEAGLDAARILGDREEECRHLSNLGGACDNLGETRKAVDYYTDALVITQELGNRSGEGFVLGSLGIAWVNLGEMKKAVEYSARSLEVSREMGDRRAEETDLNNIAFALSRLGETRTAMEHYEKALLISREVGERVQEGNNLNGLGCTFIDLHDTRKAVEYCEQALQIAREVGDPLGEGNALSGLGIAYRHQGDVQRSIEYHEKHLSLVRELGDRQSEGNALGNLGNIYAQLGETRKAIENYEKALTISRNAGDRIGVGNSCHNLAIELAKEKRFEEAIKYVEEAIEIYKSVDSPHIKSARDQLQEIRLAASM